MWTETVSQLGTSHLLLYNMVRIKHISNNHCTKLISKPKNFHSIRLPSNTLGKCLPNYNKPLRLPMILGWLSLTDMIPDWSCAECVPSVRLSVCDDQRVSPVSVQTTDTCARQCPVCGDDHQQWLTSDQHSRLQATALHKTQWPQALAQPTWPQVKATSHKGRHG